MGSNSHHHRSQLQTVTLCRPLVDLRGRGRIAGRCRLSHGRATWRLVFFCRGAERLQQKQELAHRHLDRSVLGAWARFVIRLGNDGGDAGQLDSGGCLEVDYLKAVLLGGEKGRGEGGSLHEITYASTR